MTCKFPGCVAGALIGDLCSAHANGGGKRCATCFGSGYLTYGDPRRGETPRKGACEICGGVGLVDSRRSTRIPKTSREHVDERGLIQIAEGA